MVFSKVVFPERVLDLTKCKSHPSSYQTTYYPGGTQNLACTLILLQVGPSYFKAPERLPFERYRSTTKATMIKGATEIKAAADKLHHGVIEELRATTATGKSCTSVKVKIKGKEVSPN